jgi:hypothetical protein
MLMQFELHALLSDHAGTSRDADVAALDVNDHAYVTSYNWCMI